MCINKEHQILALENRLSKGENIIYSNYKDNCFTIATSVERLFSDGRIDDYEYKLYLLPNHINEFFEAGSMRFRFMYEYCYINNTYKFLNKIKLEDIIIDKDYRKNGYATILLNLLTEYTRNHSNSILEIGGILSFVDKETPEKAEELRSFYKKRGFTVEENERYNGIDSISKLVAL
ncbi:hypothetical protein AGMMS49975_09250 [Clostridia bacterium]|nr:hypothetical protein AGMMS49975_09250 [Clostridia bacterium]